MYSRATEVSAVAQPLYLPLWLDMIKQLDLEPGTHVKACTHPWGSEQLHTCRAGTDGIGWPRVVRLRGLDVVGMMLA